MPFSYTINIFLKEIYPKINTFNSQNLAYIFKNGDFSKKIYGQDLNNFITQKYDHIDSDIKYNIQIYDTESLIGICTLIIPYSLIKEIKQNKCLTYENKLRLTIDSITKRKIFRNNKNPENIYINLKIEIFLNEKKIIKIKKIKSELLKQDIVPFSPRSFKKIPYINKINNYKIEKPQHKFIEHQQYTILNETNKSINNILTTNEYLTTQNFFKKIPINKIDKTNKLNKVKKQKLKSNSKKLSILNIMEQKYFSGNTNTNPDITNNTKNNKSYNIIICEPHTSKKIKEKEFFIKKNTYNGRNTHSYISIDNKEITHNFNKYNNFRIKEKNNKSEKLSTSLQKPIKFKDKLRVFGIDQFMNNNDFYNKRNSFIKKWKTNDKFKILGEYMNDVSSETIPNNIICFVPMLYSRKLLDYNKKITKLESEIFDKGIFVKHCFKNRNDSLIKISFSPKILTPPKQYFDYFSPIIPPQNTQIDNIKNISSSHKTSLHKKSNIDTQFLKNILLELIEYYKLLSTKLTEINSKNLLLKKIFYLYKSLYSSAKKTHNKLLFQIKVNKYNFFITNINKKFIDKKIKYNLFELKKAESKIYQNIFGSFERENGCEIQKRLEIISSKKLTLCLMLMNNIISYYGCVPRIFSNSEKAKSSFLKYILEKYKINEPNSQSNRNFNKIKVIKEVDEDDEEDEKFENGIISNERYEKDFYDNGLEKIEKNNIIEKYSLDASIANGSENRNSENGGDVEKYNGVENIKISKE